MNNTIIKKGNDFEVLNPHKANAAAIAEEAIKNAQAGPIFIMKTPSGIDVEALAEIKAQLQEFLSTGRPLVINTGNGSEIKFISLDEANRLRDPSRPGIWIEEAGPVKPEALERIADKVGKRHAAEKKWILQEDQRRERIAQLMKDDAIKKLEETQPEAFKFDQEKVRDQIRKGTAQDFEKLYFGTWDHELEKQTAEDNKRRQLAENFEAPENWTHEVSFNAAGKITGDRLSPPKNKIKRNPRTSQDATGSTNATPRDNDSAKAIKGVKPRENRGPNSKNFF